MNIATVVEQDGETGVDEPGITSNPIVQTDIRSNAPAGISPEAALKSEAKSSSQGSEHGHVPDVAEGGGHGCCSGDTLALSAAKTRNAPHPQHDAPTEACSCPTPRPPSQPFSEILPPPPLPVSRPPPYPGCANLQLPPSTVASDILSHPASQIIASTDSADDDYDQGYDTDDSSRSTSTSITSRCRAHIFEHGRRYHGSGGSTRGYPIPNDEIEQAREDMKHIMMLDILDGRLFLAPVRDPCNKILDIGTGTGSWAIDVGDMFPRAVVRGIDISPIQQQWTPPNVNFLVDDCTLDWMEYDIDLVHFRFMSIILKHPTLPLVLSRAKTALRPGGYVEFQELNGVPLCDDGTMPLDDPVRVLYDIAGAAWAHMGMDVQLPSKLGPILEAAGFVNVHLHIRKVPIGPWAKDKTLRRIGAYQSKAIQELMQSFAGRPFEALGVKKEEGLVRLALARRALSNLSVHRYFEYYFWWAQKPE